MFDFRDGDLIFTDGRNLISALIKNTQRDFAYAHVCQYFGGWIYTTGANGAPFWRFGKVVPDEYLEGQSFAVLRDQRLTPWEITQMHQTAEELCGGVYAWWKVLRLAWKGRTTSGVVETLGRKPNKFPKLVFCASAVAYGYYEAGYEYGEINPKYPQKQEADVFTPEVLYDAPDLKLFFALST